MSRGIIKKHTLIGSSADIPSGKYEHTDEDLKREVLLHKAKPAFTRRYTLHGTKTNENKEYRTKISSENNTQANSHQFWTRQDKKRANELSYRVSKSGGHLCKM